MRFDPLIRKVPWRRKWQPTPVFLLENARDKRSLTGYSPWGPKELDMTEQLFHFYNFQHNHVEVKGKVSCVQVFATS